MLVLSRRADESIRIGNDVELTILSINGKQVRIVFEAPMMSVFSARKFT